MAGYRTPGPEGAYGHREQSDDGTLQLIRRAPLPEGTTTQRGGYQWWLPKFWPWAKNEAPQPALDADTRTLAAVAYGEASTKDVYEEMAAIASVLVRQQQARGHATFKTFMRDDRTFAYAASDGNARYARLKRASEDDIAQDAGMAAAVRAARNAVDASGADYSNGAYFWDGADIKSNYDRHPKVRRGIHFTDTAHNIYNIAEKEVPGEGWLRDRDGNKLKSLGTWRYVYESTAAHGGTIFWKYNDDFLSATGNKAHK
jgi:hypothetical protein